MPRCFALKLKPYRLLGGILISSLLPVIAAAWQADNGDGTFTNPALYADYPDPDVIRVGEDFYFASTTFVNAPGLTILHSQDLINWEIVSHVIDRLDGRPEYDMDGGTAYRSGVFAPSLRYHDGTFYVVVTPVGQNTRVYRADSAAGPWTSTELDRAAFDPGFFIDDDGTGYIATSGGWDGTVTLLTLNDDFTAVVASQDIFYNQGAEGSKVVKRDDWYYMFHSIPSQLALTVSRARSLTGSWETRPQIDDTTGGHQGAVVDLPDGTFYGFVMVDSGAIGRMTNFSPIFWENDWPVWGTPDAPGRVPATAPKPVASEHLRQPATNDEFTSPTLGLQWQWNHNPDDSRWSLADRPGFLRLRSTTADAFWMARNTLIQKGQGPWSRGEVKIDVSALAAGDIAGFGTLGKINGHIAVTRDHRGDLALSMHIINDGESAETRVEHRAFSGSTLHLRTELDFRTNRATCSYSADGVNWQELGGSFAIAFDWRTGTFQGIQFALFCHNPSPSDGYIDIDYFHFSDSGPPELIVGQPVLIRAIGPTLADFGITNALPDPSITIFSGPTIRAENDDWNEAANASVIAATAQTLGGFSLPANSADAAVYAGFEPGAYTAYVSGSADTDGVVLLEIYNTASVHSRLVNLSARADAGTGENVLVAGFALSGDGATSLLIRAVGPQLVDFGVRNTMANPQLTLFDGTTPILTNDDWSNAPNLEALTAASATVGAFPLDPDSHDAALLVSLMPGTYTAQASGVAGTTGNVLVEVYAVP
ncbi:glycoside hydrolase family 43 protein [Synoicihabitans lomoniglobus]|uniref:Glycoside hydrolase 43 family protein n=1 Tax=Synoicihabitans lomoniglobus TaxID=2909285 RepID=A0AAE9ZZ33_9BACT|nr:glycoside hydrolase 43 family protein [Opitutaceae bacterium LMO-M01]WED63112.1 glycoside hydrolase 43 family protein [Opitutaceae bacterium LMO-M01]